MNLRVPSLKRLYLAKPPLQKIGCDLRRMKHGHT
jgi:hypothetical protein